MKHLITIIIVLVALAGPVNAQLSPTLDSLRTYVAALADLPFAGTDQVDTAQMIRQIVIAIRQTCVDFPAVEKIATVTVDSASEGGALPTDFRLVKSAFLSFGDTLRVPLRPLEPDSLFLVNPTLDQNLMELTDYWSIRYYRVHADSLILHPKWYRSDTASILLEYYAIDTTHMIHGDRTTLVRPKYRDKIIEYATSRLWAIRLNMTMADYWMREYEKGIVKDVD